MVLKIITTLIPVFGIIFLGLVVARRNVMPMDAASGLNQFVYWVALPAMMFDILVRLNTQGVSGGFLAALYASLVLSYALAFAVSLRRPGVGKPEAVMMSYMATFPNGAFMGVAVVSFLLPGNDFALQMAGLCAFLYSVVMAFSDTVLAMMRHKGESPSRLVLSLGKTIARNPMILAGVLGLILNASGTEPPEWAMNMASMLGGTAAPCALFSMGMVMNAQLAAMGAPPSGALGGRITVHLFKLVFMPGATFALLRAAGVTGIPLGVATLLSAMPVGVVAYVIAEKYQVCVKESSIIIFVNTVAGIVSIPAVIAVLYALNVFSL